MTLPELSVSVAGSALDPADLAALAEVRVQQRLSMPTVCQLVFVDPPGPLPTLVTMPPGAELRIGVSGFDNALFSGDVTAIEQVYGAERAREIRVRAYDRMHRLRKRHQVRTHVHITPRSLAEELVADIGLSVESEDDGPVWEMLIQDRQSDLELLTETLEFCGLHYTVREDVLHLMTLKGLDDPVSLHLGETLLEATIQVNGDPACRTVSISGWDPLTAATHTGEASVGRIPLSPMDEVAPDQLGGDGNLFFVNEGLWTEEHADAVAGAELDHRLVAEATVEGLAQGDSSLRPGAVIDVEGVDDAIADRFVLTAVDHLVDVRTGFVSKVSSQPPVRGQRSRTAAVTIGIVTRVDDPESKGRVKVRLTTIGNLETGWIEVVATAAGPGKGLVALPAVNDTVLVLLPFEDPAAGLVLGGLYGAAGAPIAGGVDAGAVRVFALLTSGGMSLTFDDAHQQIRLQDAAGSYLEFAKDAVVLQAATNIEIAAPGKQIRIRAAAVEFETA